jgi:hypothetical protein
MAVVVLAAALGRLLGGCSGSDGNPGDSGIDAPQAGITISTGTWVDTSIATSTETGQVTGSDTGRLTEPWTGQSTGHNTGLLTKPSTDQVTGHDTGLLTKPSTGQGTAYGTGVATSPSTSQGTGMLGTSLCYWCGFVCCVAGEACTNLGPTSDGACIKTSPITSTWSATETTSRLR